MAARDVFGILLTYVCMFATAFAILWWASLLVNLVEAAFSPQHRQDLFGDGEWIAVVVISLVLLVIGIGSLLFLFR